MPAPVVNISEFNGDFAAALMAAEGFSSHGQRQSCSATAQWPADLDHTRLGKSLHQAIELCDSRAYPPSVRRRSLHLPNARTQGIQGHDPPSRHPHPQYLNISSGTADWQEGGQELSGYVHRRSHAPGLAGASYAL